MILPVSNVVSAPTLNSSITSVGTNSSSTGGNFASVLNNALQSVSETVRQSQLQGVGLAAGTSTNLASVMTSATQAQLAVDLTVQVQNRVVAAYQQVMNMQV